MQAGESSTRRERLHVSVGFFSLNWRSLERGVANSGSAGRHHVSCDRACGLRAVRRAQHGRSGASAGTAGTAGRPQQKCMTRPSPLSWPGSAEGRRHGRGLGHEGDTPREDGGGRGGRHTARCARYRLRMRHRGRQAGNRLRPRRRARQRRPLRQEGPGGGRAVRAGALHLGEQGLTGCEAGCRAASGLAGRTVNSL